MPDQTRHSADPSRPEPGDHSHHSQIQILIVGGSHGVVDKLNAALGARFIVTSAGLHELPPTGIVVDLDNRSLGPAVVHASTPDIGYISVVDAIAPTSRSIELLRAGADACLTNPSIEELAAYVNVVARRLRL